MHIYSWALLKFFHKWKHFLTLNMNGNLKLVSWITHPQPFLSLSISPTYWIWRQWESFTALMLTFFPPWMSEVVAAIIWECHIYRKGKISKENLQSWFTSIYQIISNFGKIAMYIWKYNVLYFPHQDKVWWEHCTWLKGQY